VRLTWEYIGGFFDGEGSTGIRSNGRENSYGYYPRTSLVQTGERGRQLLTEIQDFCANHNIRTCLVKGKKHKEHYTQGWYLSVNAKDDVKRFLENIVPYLRIKRTEAQDVLRTLKIFPRLKSKSKKEI